MRLLEAHHGTLPQGLIVAANLNKIAEVFQRPTKSLMTCLEAYQTYIPFDSEAPENSQTVNKAFVIQLAPDILHKL